MNSIDIQEILLLLGAKEVELYLLKKHITKLEEEIKKLISNKIEGE